MGNQPNNVDPNFETESERYDHPVPSRDFIIAHLEKTNESLTYEDIVEDFSLRSDEEREGIRRRLIAMVRDGQLLKNRERRYSVLDPSQLIQGVVQGHRDGYGFVVTPAGENDLFLPEREMQTVFTDDVVLVRDAGRRGSKREARIIKVLERHTHSIVGRFFQEGDTLFIQPESNAIGQDVLVTDTGGVDCVDGDYVLASILTQPTRRHHATAALIKRLGNAREPGMESELAAYAHGIPCVWPDAIQAELDAIPDRVSESDCLGRVDYRNKPFITIDGATSRDFDDAVLAEPSADGGWTLWVAIADVASYVKPGSELDKEAYSRGNSVYFPNEVIPMLPEKLSNGICSLNPHEDRLTLVCQMSISSTGDLVCDAVQEAVIHSHARMQYSQVTDIIENQSQHPQSEQIQSLLGVYQVLKERRDQRGAIEFETQEPIFSFDEQSKIVGMSISQRTIAHRIIEEAMLAANVCVAQFLKDAKVPCLYRIHQAPTMEKSDALNDFLSGFGLRLSSNDEPTIYDYMQLMEQVNTRDDAHLLQTVILRSMMQAVYSPENSGHFGLGYTHYCHFTSPIRRYPDLLVHRAVRHVLHGGTKDGFFYQEESYVDFGEHLSMTERRADRASRDAMDRLKCEYMEDKLGESFSARVIDVVSFGLFIECDDIYVQGLVHISALPKDYYHHNRSAHNLVGKRCGRKFSLGDQLNVTLARVDVDEKKMDFVLQ